jgi:alanyl-tRNA synthetase
VEEITGLKYTPNSVILNDSEESEEQNKTNIAIRVIVDHVRAVAFAIADGQLPSNTGAGDSAYFTSCNTLRIYFLNIKEPFIYQLVAVLADQMGEVFLKSENNKV